MANYIKSFRLSALFSVFFVLLRPVVLPAQEGGEMVVSRLQLLDAKSMKPIKGLEVTPLDYFMQPIKTGTGQLLYQNMAYQKDRHPVALKGSTYFQELSCDNILAKSISYIKITDPNGKYEDLLLNLAHEKRNGLNGVRLPVRDTLLNGEHYHLPLDIFIFRPNTSMAGDKIEADKEASGTRKITLNLKKPANLEVYADCKPACFLYRETVNGWELNFADDPAPLKKDRLKKEPARTISAEIPLKASHGNYRTGMLTVDEKGNRKFHLSPIYKAEGMDKNSATAIQPLQDNIFTGSELQEDIKKLDLGIKLTHNQKFTDDPADTGIQYLALYRSVARRLASLHDLNSYAAHSAAYLQYRQDSMRLLPLEVKVIGNRLYDFRNLSHNYSLQEGDEILSINGLSAKEILDSLRLYIPQEGSNTSRFERLVSDKFMFLYSDLIANGESFEITYRSLRDSQRGTTLMPTMKLAEMEGIKRYRYPELYSKLPDNRPLQYYYDNHLLTGLITINSFDENTIRNKGEDLGSFLKASFGDLQRRNAKTLVIDLRNNSEGQIANGMLLYSYFCDSAFAYISQVEVHQKDLDKLNAEWPAPYTESMQIKNGVWANYPNTGMQGQPLAYQGKIIIITNGNTLGSAAIFSAMMQEHKKAKVVGEETGTAYTGPKGMAASFLLPNSQIRVWLSTARYSPALQDNGKTTGVVPQRPVHYSIADYLNTTDLELDLIRRIILGQEK